jgi:protein-tyrosine phosphatase
LLSLQIDIIEDEKHVIVVHCNSGKGRTGTAIASLLVFSGFVNNMDDALRYYGWKRFSSGTGVTQPC